MNDLMPCPKREEALALHAGRDLPEPEARELERHLAGCADCRAFLAEMEESLQILTQTAVAPPAADLAAIHRGVMEQVKREKSGRWPVRWAAAAAILLILGALLLWRLGTDHDPGSQEPGDPVIASRTEEPPLESPPEPRQVPPSELRERSPQVPRAPREPVSATPETPPLRDETPQPNVAPEPRPDSRSVPEPETQRASLVDDPPDLKIQLVSDDPDVVIYWLVETETTRDATPAT